MPTPPPRVWADLALAANVALAAFALPIYLRLYSGPGAEALLHVVLLVHVAPAIVLFLVARLLSRRAPVHRTFWTGSILLGTVSLLRGIEMVVSSRYLETFDPLDLAASTPAPHILDVTFYICAAIVIFACALLLRERYAGFVSAIASLAPVWAIATLAFLVPLLLAPVPRAAVPPGAQPDGPVYVFVLDGLGRDVVLSNGRVDAALYPSFASLAAEGLLFTNATSNWGFTCHALPAMTGGVSLGPCGDGYLADPAMPTLFSALSDRYRVVIYEEWLRTCPNGVPYDCRDPAYLTATYPGRTLLAHWVPRTIRLRLLGGLGADAIGGSYSPYTLEAFREVVEDLDDPHAASTAAFVHLLIPHYPFVFDADGSVHGRLPRHFNGLPETEPATYDHYIRQSRFADLLLGRFLDALRDRGLYDRATIVVTGDHGPSPALDWVGPLSREHAYVTLIMRGPGIPQGTTDMDYQHADLTPTLTDVLGLEPVQGSVGVSVLAEDRPERDKRFNWRGELFRLDPVSGAWILE